MKKNGFTLIELLAIITILAIIATITSIIVLDIIDDTKESTFETSLQSVYRAIEEDYISNSYINTQTYQIGERTIKNVTAGETEYTITFNGKINKATGTANVEYNDEVGALLINIDIKSSEFCGENITKNGVNEFVIKHYNSKNNTCN